MAVAVSSVLGNKRGRNFSLSLAEAAVVLENLIYKVVSSYTCALTCTTSVKDSTRTLTDVIIKKCFLFWSGEEEISGFHCCRDCCCASHVPTSQQQQQQAHKREAKTQQPTAATATSSCNTTNEVLPGFDGRTAVDNFSFSSCRTQNTIFPRQSSLSAITYILAVLFLEWYP